MVIMSLILTTRLIITRRNLLLITIKVNKTQTSKSVKGQSLSDANICILLQFLCVLLKLRKISGF